MSGLCGAYRAGGAAACLRRATAAGLTTWETVAALDEDALEQRLYPAAAAKPVATVPDVSGRGVRAAVLAVHQRGFRARVKGMGQAVRTDPVAGSTATAGTVVTIWTGE